MNLHILILSTSDRACKMLRRLVVLMALMGFSLQSLGAACMMMPNQMPGPVETSMLAEQMDCHGQELTLASTASISDSSDGISSDGISSDGISSDGISSDGISSDGISSDGISSEHSSDDCCDGNCLMMNCQAATVIDAASGYSTSPNIIHVLPTVQVDPASTRISVVYRPPILS
ncbi:MAG: hypothetical protein ACJAXW_000948 [Candidatus Azotimanducaceae bacterium]